MKRAPYTVAKDGRRAQPERKRYRVVVDYADGEVSVICSGVKHMRDVVGQYAVDPKTSHITVMYGARILRNMAALKCDA